MDLSEPFKVRKRLTLGADPEIFAFKDGSLFPAFEFLPSKCTSELIYWDGFQAEWKYREAWKCQNNFVKATRESLMEMSERAAKQGASLSLVNVVRIPNKLLNTTDYQYVQLGCEPSYNVYKLRGISVENPRLLKYRFAGGHMHFGSWSRRPNYEKIVKTLDSILGVWATGVAQRIDNPVRRRYYGKPGEYRMPKYGYNEYKQQQYGIEYRTLSNFWLSSPPVMQATWDLGRICVKLASTDFTELWVANQDEVIETIEQCDYEQARKIIKRNEQMFKWLLGHQRTYGPKTIEKSIALCQKGMEEFVDNIHDFAKNWHFADMWQPNAGAEWARFGVI